MKYYIGLDGGGTKTLCVSSDENAKIEYQAKGGPSNFLIRGTEEVSKTIYDLIQEVVKPPVSWENVEGIVLGTTGAGRREDAMKLEKAVILYAQSQGLTLPPFRVESDARIALEGAFSGEPGSILIAGTGSILFGKDVRGKIHRVGGFGRMIGDEGSGYSIGRKGIMLFAKEYDSRGASTLLTQTMKQELHIEDGPSLINEVYNNKFEIPSVTPLVIRCAAEGDEGCRAILEEEAGELVLHVAAVMKKMNLQKMKLSLIGSLISTENYYAELFKKKIRTALPNVTIHKPDHEPHIGAVLMAKEISPIN